MKNVDENDDNDPRAVRCECVRQRTSLEANIQNYSEHIAKLLTFYHKTCSGNYAMSKECGERETNIWHDLIFLEGLLHAQLDRLDAPGYDGTRDAKRARNEQMLKRVR